MYREYKDPIKSLIGTTLFWIIILILTVGAWVSYRGSIISNNLEKTVTAQAESRKAKAYLVTEIDGCKTYNVFGEFKRGDNVRSVSTFFTVCENSSTVKTGSEGGEPPHETLKGNKQ